MTFRHKPPYALRGNDTKPPKFNDGWKNNLDEH